MLTTQQALAMGTPGSIAALLFFASGADPFFHLIEILSQRAASGWGEAVFGARDAAFEKLDAGNVLGFFELAGVHAEIAVGSFEDAFEIVESQGFIGGESADNAEANAFVNQAVELRKREHTGNPHRPRSRGLVLLGVFVVLAQRSNPRASWQ